MSYDLTILENGCAELGIELAADNKKVAEFADILFMAVKPQYYEQVIDTDKNTIISEDEISDGASPELAQIRRKIAGAHSKIREILNGIIHSAKYQKCLHFVIGRAISRVSKETNLKNNTLIKEREP